MTGVQTCALPILALYPRHMSKGGGGQAVRHLPFASVPDDTTLADKSDRKLGGWFFSAAPFSLLNTLDILGLSY